MYLAMRLYQIQIQSEVEEKEKDPEPGPVVYAAPSLMEYVIIPNKDIPRLKAYIRSTPNPVDVLRKAGKRGFPLYFRLFRSPFTDEKIYGILKDDTEGTMENRGIIHCINYDQRVHPALCISRNLLYPKEVPPSEYYLEVKEKLKFATTKDEKKRLRRELKKHSPVLDPYPKCRSCKMAKKLIHESCLGAEYDPDDAECTSCPSQRECCQLMRLRIERILSGAEDEVATEILRDWKKLHHKRKEVKEMAKKKKAQEVTEEVVEETTEAKEDKKKARRKDRAEARKKRSKATAEPEEKTSKKKSKSKADPVKKLLRELQEAKDEGDQVTARKIRAELRSHGYSLRDQNKK